MLELIEEASLPTAGLAEHRRHLYVLEVRGKVIGAVGYESHPPDALLRSLVVAPAARGQGYGRRLLEFIMGRARRDGVRGCYGLTTTIPDLLARLGFTEIGRADVPEALLASEELRGVCPARARSFRIPATLRVSPSRELGRGNRRKGTPA